MYVTTLWNSGERLIEINTKKDTASNLADYIPQQAQELFLQATACNSSATIDPPSGDATEQAIVKFLHKCSINFLELRKKYPEVIYIPFSS